MREKDDEGQAADERADGPIVLDAVMTGGTAVADAPTRLAVPSPMADLPVGTGFGTLVHAVFESADLTAPDLRAELLRCVHAELDRHPTPAVDPDALADALVPVARTPLGPLADDRCLADIAPPGPARRARLRAAARRWRHPRRGRPARRPRRRCCAGTSPRRPRSPATPTGSHAAGGATAARATSPAASTPSCACRAPGSPSSTTRPTGSAPSGRTARSRWSPRTTRPDGWPTAMLRRALPAAGAALRRGPAPVPALAAARLRPAPAPRRGALPVPARHVRAGRSRGRRRALRCLRLAAACGTGDGAVGPARSGSPVTGRVLLDDPHDARVARTATGVLAAFNAAGVLEPADVHVAGAHRAARRRVGRRRAARGGARGARGAAGLGVRRPAPRCEARCSARATSPSTSPGCPGPSPPAGSRPAQRARSSRPDRTRRPGARSGSSTGCSTWSGTGGRRRWSAPSWPRAPASRRRWTSTGCVPRWPGCSATTAIRARTASGSPRP